MSSFRAKPPKGSLLQRGDPLARGLVAAWLFNEGAGPRVEDSVAKDTGTLTSFEFSGASGWLGGPFGKCLGFDGVDDKVLLASTLVLAADFSLFCWVKCTGDCAILGKNGVSQPQLRIGQTANKLSTFDSVNNPQSNTLAVAQTSWSFIGFTRSGSTITFWQNAISYGTGTSDPAFGAAANNFDQIGAFLTNANAFNGQMDGLTIHNRTLPTAEVRQLYADSFRMFRRRSVPVPLHAAAAAAAGGLLLKRRRMMTGMTA